MKPTGWFRSPSQRRRQLSFRWKPGGGGATCRPTWRSSAAIWVETQPPRATLRAPPLRMPSAARNCASVTRPCVRRDGGHQDMPSLDELRQRCICGAARAQHVTCPLRQGSSRLRQVLHCAGSTRSRVALLEEADVTKHHHVGSAAARHRRARRCSRVRRGSLRRRTARGTARAAARWAAVAHRVRAR